MENFVNVLQNIRDQLTIIVIPVAVVLTIVCGIWWMTCTRRGDDGPKELIKKIVIGILLSLSAPTIVEYIANIFTF